MGPVTTDRSRACQISEAGRKYAIQARCDGLSARPPNTPPNARIWPARELTRNPTPMASNQDTLVTVFGGSGFLGRNVVRALAKREYRIRVAVRRPELTGYLQPLGRVGQIHAVQANLRYPASVEAAMRDSHVAVNLVAVLSESGAQTFDAVQVKGAETVAKVAAAAGASMVHVSAIGADDKSTSHYARAKAAGEAAVLAAVPSAVIMRPSVVFGPEDQFTNRFAALARLAPALPLVGGGTTKMQPVYVGDVAAAIAEDRK